VPTNDDSNNNDISTIITESLIVAELKHEEDYSHKGENCHSKNKGEQSVKELDIEHQQPDLKSKIKEELEKSDIEQQILLKENKQNIIDFLLGNKDSIRIEDLKSYEPIYKCYREKGNCYICNILSNIICKNCCNNYNNNNEEIWLCANHWKQHEIEKHI
jgi:hypothetical protein